MKNIDKTVLRMVNFSFYSIYSNVNYFPLPLSVKTYLKTYLFVVFLKKSSAEITKVYI